MKQHLSLILSVILSINLNAQVETEYVRPSMTHLFISPITNNVSIIYNEYSKMPMLKKYNDYRVSDNILNVNLPNRPFFEDYSLLQTKKFKQDKAAWQEQSEKIIKDGLNPYGRKIFSKLLAIDSEGNMSWDRILQQAEYSATDNEVLVANSSKNKANVIESIGDKILNRAYITVYNIDKIQTYTEYYNDYDNKARARAAKNGTEFQPISRTTEGWKVEYSFYVLKIDFNEESYNDFSNNVWLDKSITDPTERNNRIQAFNNFKFNFNTVLVKSNSITSSQSNNPENYKSGLFTRYSMEELLRKLPELLDNEVDGAMGRNTDDFNVRGPLFEEKPLSFKLGTKEGLYYDQRFYVYDIVQNKKGEEKKKRRGIVRVKTISDNSEVSSGNTTPSLLSQHGGKRLYQGNLVEAKEDRGFGFNLGYGVPNDFGYYGFMLGAEMRLAPLLKSKNSKAIRGMFFNIGMAINSDYGTSIGGFLAKEIPLLWRGRIFITPEIGGGVITEDFESYDEYFVQGNLGIGLQISPAMSAMVKVGFPTPFQIGLRFMY